MNKKLTPAEFVEKYLPIAKAVQDKTGIKRIAMLTQAALESRWGKSAPGNMYLGVKATKSEVARKHMVQLLRTTEYSKRDNLSFPKIYSITPVVMNGKTMYKYIVRDYFRRFNNAEESFMHHANMFLNNKRRWGKALEVKADPYLFLEEVAKAGYATDPNYYKKLRKIAVIIQKEVEKIESNA